MTIIIIVIISMINIMTTCAEQWKLRGRYFSLTVCNAGEIVMFVGGKWTLITISLNGDQEEYHADADADADDLKRVLLETAGPSWVEKYK